MRKIIKQLLGGKDKEPTPERASPDSTPKESPLTPKLANSPIAVERFSREVPHPGEWTDSPRPLVSFVLIVYKMPNQAEKTLRSLSVDYQQGVTADDYEVIVVENASSSTLGEERACQYSSNVRYFYREETLHSPVPAVNFGAAQAQGTHICIMVDGARMLSPAVVSYIAAAARLHPAPVVAVPGYHLGHKLQQRAMLEGYCEEEEEKLLTSIGWPSDGYRLFEIACLSGTSGTGYFKPIGESNCLCVTRQIWELLGGFDPAFTETGGGQVNLDFYKRAVEIPDTLLVILIGEGSFHQFHGGITTGTQGEARVKSMEDHFNQYASLRGGPYRSPTKRPVYLGSVADSSIKFLHHGTTQALKAQQSREPAPNPLPGDRDKNIESPV
jgi:hypothetical protein